MENLFSLLLVILLFLLIAETIRRVILMRKEEQPRSVSFTPLAQADHEPPTTTGRFRVRQMLHTTKDKPPAPTPETGVSPQESSAVEENKSAEKTSAPEDKPLPDPFS